MITEDYVSFETAKLLKEKGFDWDCKQVYDLVRPQSCADGKMYDNFSDKNPNANGELVSAPTLQMAMKWLRKVHNFNVNNELNIHGYFCSLSYIVRDSSGHIIDIEDSEAWETAYYDSYEEACEAAIRYTLENLIN